MKQDSQVLGVRLTDEQQLLVETCRRVVADHPTTAPAPGGRVPFAASAWTALVDAGLHALGDPAAGASLLDTALVAEELARGPLAVPFVATQLALEQLTTTGDHDGLDAIAAGAPAYVVLDDQLCNPAPHGWAFDRVAGAVTPGAVTLGEAVDGIDLTRALARATGGPSVEPDALERWTTIALTLIAADLVGTMTGALDAAVAHARDREQFGRPVGSFQAVQHLCADQLVSIEAARSATWQAASSEDLGAARVAKAYCSEVAREVVEAAIQVLGGIGMTWEHPAHLYLRRALLDRQLLGDEQHQWSVLADDLLGAGAPA